MGVEKEGGGDYTLRRRRDGGKQVERRTREGRELPGGRRRGGEEWLLHMFEVTSAPVTPFVQ